MIKKLPKRQRPSFWWDVFIKGEEADYFLRRTKAVSAEKAVNNVWFTEIKELYSLDGRMEEAKEIRFKMYAKLASFPAPRRLRRYRHHRRIPGQLFLFRTKK